MHSPPRNIHFGLWNKNLAVIVEPVYIWESTYSYNLAYSNTQFLCLGSNVEGSCLREQYCMKGLVETSNFAHSHSHSTPLPAVCGGPRDREKEVKSGEASACVTLPHLFPSREVPFLLVLEPGGLSPGAKGPPEDRELVRGPPAVVARHPPRGPSPEFCLLQYSTDEVGKEPLWLKAEAEGSML